MIPFRGNRVALLKNGAEFFPALEAAIDGALHEVRLETYIYAEDAAGRRIAEALKRAAQRGVHVRLLLDGFGSRALGKAFLPDLRATGVMVQVFRPERGWLRLRKSRRLHFSRNDPTPPQKPKGEGSCITNPNPPHIPFTYRRLSSTAPPKFASARSGC